MSTAAREVVVSDLDLALRDLHHMEARAASDLADWLVFLAVEDKADRTLYAYAQVVKGLLRAHPEKAIDEFTAADINQQILKAGGRSKHITRSIYNRFFEWAAYDERLTKNPMHRVPTIRHPHRRPKDIFSEAEAGLLEGLPSPDGPLWTLLFGSGIRRGEARHLRRQHVDLTRERLMVINGKGGKDRIVPIPQPVLMAVSDLDLLDQLQPQDHLWYTDRGTARRYRRDPISNTTFERWYKRGIEQAKVRYLNPHQTRHSYGNALREKGFTLEERQLLMGHEDIATTQKYYGHLTIEDVAVKVKAL